MQKIDELNIMIMMGYEWSVMINQKSKSDRFFFYLLLHCLLDEVKSTVGHSVGKAHKIIIKRMFLP